MIVGYARVSTTNQNLDAQIELLKKAGAEKIFTEKKSGLDGDREVLQECLDFLREKDTLVITRLDRLARSTLHLFKIKELLESKGVFLKVTEQNLDTSTSTGKLLFGLLGLIAEFETSLRKERQLEGIEKAKKIGKKFGREKIIIEDEKLKWVLEEKAKGTKMEDLAKSLGITRNTLYVKLREYQKENISDKTLVS
jgi:DNA invertase Pin-like site-specific DNA recombinase